MRNSGQMRLRARAICLSFVFFLLFCTFAQAPNACQQTRTGTGNSTEIKDSRLLATIRAAIKVTGLKTRVVLCELSMPYLSATVENLDGYYRVGITRTLLEKATRAELFAVIGHEVAHIVLGHRARTFELAHNRAAEYERAADTLSARWFGKGPMRTLLRKLRIDASRLPEGSLRERAIVELDQRIAALQ